MEEAPWDSSKYPSIELAYQFVEPSYSWALDRLRAVESRIERLLTLIAAVTLAVPVAATAMSNSQLLDGQAITLNLQVTIAGGLALLCVIISVAAGLYGRRMGTIKLVDLTKLYEFYLSQEQVDFRKDTVYFAGKNLRANNKLINYKTGVADLMSGLLIAEIILGVIWAYPLLSS